MIFHSIIMFRKGEKMKNIFLIIMLLMMLSFQSLAIIEKDSTKAKESTTVVQEKSIIIPAGTEIMVHFDSAKRDIL